ncbi:MAG: hypothetical protein MUO67_20205 [Anaerolineales bacterium]|nr:hypothetical protein [Anaerolineales bacterium]
MRGGKVSRSVGGTNVFVGEAIVAEGGSSVFEGFEEVLIEISVGSLFEHATARINWLPNINMYFITI